MMNKDLWSDLIFIVLFYFLQIFNTFFLKYVWNYYALSGMLSLNCFVFYNQHIYY